MTSNKDHGLGHNSAGHPYLRYIASLKGLFDHKADFSSFRNTEAGAAVSDIDGVINVGNGKQRINIILEFKEEGAGDRMPLGQQLTLCNTADDIHVATSALNGIPLTSRAPGTISLVIRCTHPRQEVYDIAEDCKVHSVYSARKGFTEKGKYWKNQYLGWNPLVEDITLAQYLDLLADMLIEEKPSNANRKLKALTTTGLQQTNQTPYTK